MIISTVSIVVGVVVTGLVFWLGWELKNAEEEQPNG